MQELIEQSPYSDLNSSDFFLNQVSEVIHITQSYINI